MTRFVTLGETILNLDSIVYVRKYTGRGDHLYLLVGVIGHEKEIYIKAKDAAEQESFFHRIYGAGNQP
jgi:hypothetical protein